MAKHDRKFMTFYKTPRRRQLMDMAEVESMGRVNRNILDTDGLILITLHFLVLNWEAVEKNNPSWREKIPGVERGMTVNGAASGSFFFTRSDERERLFSIVSTFTQTGGGAETLDMALLFLILNWEWANRMNPTWKHNTKLFKKMVTP